MVMACFMDTVMSQGEMLENWVWSHFIFVAALGVHMMAETVFHI